MGIAIAQATLQSLVNEHKGISYHQAMDEIRAYIADVQPNSLQQLNPKMPSLQEYLRWALEPESGFRSHEEIFNYFARHFGH